MDIWVASTFSLLWIMLLCTFLKKYLFEYPFPILLSMYLVVELLVHTVIPCLIFWGTTKLFSTVATLYHFTFPQHVTSIPISPHPCQHLFSIWVFSFFLNNYPSGYEVVLIVVSLCISLMTMLLNIFSCSCWTFACLLWRNVYSSLNPRWIRLLFSAVVEQVIWTNSPTNLRTWKHPKMMRWYVHKDSI